MHISAQWQYYYIRSYSITPTSVSSEARAQWWNVMDEERNSKWHQDLFSQHTEIVCEQEHIERALSLSNTETVFCSYYAVWAKCSYFKSKSFKWITGLSRPLWGEKQCCTSEQATAGSLSQLLKVNWKQPPNLRLFKQEKADCLNSLRVSKRGGNNAAFFLTFH